MKKYWNDDAFGLITDPNYDSHMSDREYRERINDPNDAFNIANHDYQFPQANRGDPFYRLEAYDIEQALQGIKGNISVDEMDGGNKYVARVDYGDGQYFELIIYWERLGWHYGIDPFHSSEDKHPYDIIGQSGIANNSNDSVMTAGEVLEYIRKVPEGFNALHPDL